MSKDNNMEGWSFVKNVADDQEAVLVESVLGTENIPVQRKYKEAGYYMEVYMGMSKYGLDLYVPDYNLELAKGLLESETMDMPEETGAEEVARDAEKYGTKRRSIVWVILLYLFLPALAALLWKLFT